MNLIRIMNYQILKAISFWCFLFRDAGADFVAVSNIEPVLGRGYSTGSGVQYGTCIKPQNFTTPAIDYSYFFTEISNAQSVEEGLSGKISETLSLSYLIEQISEDRAGGNDLQHVVALLMFEHDGISFTEENLTLQPDAKALLESFNSAPSASYNEGLIAFFSMCGPGYIRSIKKVAELAILFAYPTKNGMSSADYNNAIITDTESAVSLVAGSPIDDGQPLMLTDMWDYGMWMGIRLRAIGLTPATWNSGFMLKMTQDGLVGTMRHAFESMRQPGAGVAVGIEVVPWTSEGLFNNEVNHFDMGLLDRYYLLANAEFLSTINDVMDKKLKLVSMAGSCLIEASRISGTKQAKLVRNWKNHHVPTDGSYGCRSNIVALDEVDLTYISAQRLLHLLSPTTYETTDPSMWITNYYSNCIKELATCDSSEYKNQKFIKNLWSDIGACDITSCLNVDSVWANSGCTISAANTGLALARRLVESYCPLTLTNLSCN